MLDHKMRSCVSVACDALIFSMTVRIESSFSAQFGTMNGLIQGYVLACLLFNVLLEKVI
jgi:hypothetical protein